MVKPQKVHGSMGFELFYYFLYYDLGKIGGFMEVTVKLDWPNHEHVFTQTTRTTDHYNDVEINHCVLCDRASAASGITTREHHKHPKGCKCYWCVYCNCDKLQERERASSCSECGDTGLSRKRHGYCTCPKGKRLAEEAMVAGEHGL